MLIKALMFYNVKCTPSSRDDKTASCAQNKVQKHSYTKKWA